MVQVKNNQPTLLKQIQDNVANLEAIDEFCQEQRNRGRTEKRYLALYDNIQGISQQWKGIQQIIHVHRSGNRPGKGKYSKHHYYITSRCFDKAQVVATGIRQHWWIENKLHYVKDTHFNEDKNRISNNNAAAILSIIQDIAINIYRCKGFSSTKNATIFFANKVNELFKFLSAKHISDL